MKVVKCRLPFDFDRYIVKIIQGFHGPFSHYDLNRYGIPMDLSFAVDFQLPVNAEVVAAKPGIVKVTFDRSKEFYEGVDPNVGNKLPVFSTNLVMVEHGDGTFAIYSHLGRKSSRVRVGQDVSEGQILAYTGRSGWIGSYPHFHFFVYQEEPRRTKLGFVAKKFVSLPVTFQSYDGPLEHVELFDRSKNKGRA